MFKSLLPRETSFFGYFQRHTKITIEACRELDSFAANPGEMGRRADRIKEIEHQADDITRECIGALHRTFITPIDRSDIHRLIKRLDDIVDSVDSVASRMALYEMSKVRPEFKQFTEALVRAATEIDGAITHLDSINKDGSVVQKHCIAVYEAENQADQILRAALGHLFKEEKDPVMVIKWKEIFERLERATDRCEEVANIVSGIVIEAS